MSEKQSNRGRLKFMTWGQGLEAAKKKAGRTFKKVKKTAKQARDWRVTVPGPGAGTRWLKNRKKKRIAKEEASGSRFSTKYDLGASKKKDVPKADSKRYSRKEEDKSRGSKTGPFGGPNPFRKKVRTFGDDVKAASSKSSSKSSSSYKSSSSKSKSKSKGEWKPTAIQKKLMKGGWTKEELQAKQKAHQEWKANRSKAKIKKRKRKSSGYQYKGNILKSLNK